MTDAKNVNDMILNHIPYAIFLVDEQWNLLGINNIAAEIYKKKPEELIGKNLIKEYPIFSEMPVYKHFKNTFHKKKPIIWRDIDKKTKKWYEIYATPYKGTLTITYKEITNEIRTHEQISFQASLLNQVRNAVIATDMNNKIIYWNTFAEVLYQWKSKEVLNKKFIDVVIPAINKSAMSQILQKAIKKGKWEGELEVIKKNKETFIIHFAISSFKNDEGDIIGTVGISTDITERKQIEEEIRYLSRHDPLTQLPNRTLLDDDFTQAMEAASTNGSMLAVLFIDLDRFKFINDTLGHILGDKLLKIIADRMKFAMRPSDIIARIGGDEFMVLLKNISQVDEVTAIANRILKVFEPVFYLDSHEIHITASIGISLYPHDGKDVQTLLKNADSAMYRAKEQGKNNYELYSAILNEKAMENLMLQNNLQDALVRNEFVIYYQPIVNIKTKQTVGLEALLRWRHPQLGIIAPSDFIPLAEETGIILPITEWVLKKACFDCKDWHSKGYENLYVAVNLSSQHFNKKNWDKMILDALSESKLAPVFLELEINENSIMKNTPQTIKIINSLRQKGIKFSIDDFGTGYSSLSYLTQFPIDGLKIDQSFMRFITTDSDDATIITAIIYMAHNLNLRVTAEGIENINQLKFMDSIDCDYAQGYFFSRPIPKIEADSFLKQSP